MLNSITVSATLLTDCHPSIHTNIHSNARTNKDTHAHTHSVCPQLLGPQVDPWVLHSRLGKVQQPWRGPRLPPSPTANQHHQALLVQARLGLLGQAADGQIVNHLLNLLHVVLEAVVAFPQRVVLQVEQTEARVQLVDEVGDA